MMTILSILIYYIQGSWKFYEIDGKMVFGYKQMFFVFVLFWFFIFLESLLCGIYGVTSHEISKQQKQMFDRIFYVFFPIELHNKI